MIPNLNSQEVNGVGGKDQQVGIQANASSVSFNVGGLIASVRKVLLFSLKNIYGVSNKSEPDSEEDEGYSAETTKETTSDGKEIAYCNPCENTEGVPVETIVFQDGDDFLVSSDSIEDTKKTIDSIVSKVSAAYSGMYENKIADHLLIVTEFIRCIQEKKFLLPGLDNQLTAFRYLAHLCSVAGKVKAPPDLGNKNLEGFSAGQYLFLHAWFLLYSIIRIQKSELSSGGKFSYGKCAANVVIEKLQKELLLTAEAAKNFFDIWSCSEIKEADKCTYDIKDKDVERIARLIVGKIVSLENDKEYVIPSGYNFFCQYDDDGEPKFKHRGHSIYVSFMRKNDRIYIRIDNRGFGVELHKRNYNSNKNRWYAEPKIIAIVPMKDLEKNDLFVNYVKQCCVGLLPEKTPLKVEKDTLTQKGNAHALQTLHDAEKKIGLYDYVGQVDLSTDPILPSLKFKPRKQQMVGNCVFQSWEVGQEIRLQNWGLYKWLKFLEYSFAAESAKILPKVLPKIIGKIEADALCDSSNVSDAILPADMWVKHEARSLSLTDVFKSPAVITRGDAMDLFFDGTKVVSSGVILVDAVRKVFIQITMTNQAQGSRFCGLYKRNTLAYGFPGDVEAEYSYNERQNECNFLVTDLLKKNEIMMVCFPQDYRFVFGLQCGRYLTIKTASNNGGFQIIDIREKKIIFSDTSIKMNYAMFNDEFAVLISYYYGQVHGRNPAARLGFHFQRLALKTSQISEIRIIILDMPGWRPILYDDRLCILENNGAAQVWDVSLLTKLRDFKLDFDENTSGFSRVVLIQNKFLVQEGGMNADFAAIYKSDDWSYCGSIGGQYLHHFYNIRINNKRHEKVVFVRQNFESDGVVKRRVASQERSPHNPRPKIPSKISQPLVRLWNIDLFSEIPLPKEIANLFSGEFSEKMHQRGQRVDMVKFVAIQAYDNLLMVCERSEKDVPFLTSRDGVMSYEHPSGGRVVRAQRLRVWNMDSWVCVYDNKSDLNDKFLHIVMGGNDIETGKILYTPMMSHENPGRYSRLVGGAVLNGAIERADMVYIRSEDLDLKILSFNDFAVRPQTKNTAIVEISLSKNPNAKFSKSNSSSKNNETKEEGVSLDIGH